MTIFLLKVIGLYMLIVGIAMLMNKKLYKKMMKELSSDSSSLTISIFGFLSLVIGLMIVLSHNLWGSVPQIIISLIGWLSLFKGATLLIFPDKHRKLCKKVASKDKHFDLYCWLVLILGAYITYMAFQCCIAPWFG